jgi:hypothetical protein
MRAFVLAAATIVAVCAVFTGLTGSPWPQPPISRVSSPSEKADGKPGRSAQSIASVVVRIVWGGIAVIVCQKVRSVLTRYEMGPGQSTGKPCLDLYIANERRSARRMRRWRLKPTSPN